jgi:hypothetical protein
MIHLTENQVKDIAREDDPRYEIISEETVRRGRWRETKEIIFKDGDGRMYSLYCEKRLTETCDNVFEEQDCPEVEEYEETVVIKKYRVRE